jgi:hypothetical protein
VLTTRHLLTTYSHTDLTKGKALLLMLRDVNNVMDEAPSRRRSINDSLGIAGKIPTTRFFSPLDIVHNAAKPSLLLTPQERATYSNFTSASPKPCERHGIKPRSQPWTRSHGRATLPISPFRPKLNSNMPHRGSSVTIHRLRACYNDAFVYC